MLSITSASRSGPVDRQAISHPISVPIVLIAALLSCVALMIERYPTIDVDAARLALTAAAVDLGPPGSDDQFGAGHVNAFAALRAIAGTRTE
jgi:hypothetical protein